MRARLFAVNLARYGSRAPRSALLRTLALTSTKATKTSLF
jgi:hypothetical protein